MSKYRKKIVNKATFFTLEKWQTTNNKYNKMLLKQNNDTYLAYINVSFFCLTHIYEIHQPTMDFGNCKKILQHT